jgi:hypothetical protein
MLGIRTETDAGTQHGQRYAHGPNSSPIATRNTPHMRALANHGVYMVSKYYTYYSTACDNGIFFAYYSP